MLRKKPLSVAVATAIGVVSASGALTNVAYAADESLMEEVVVTGSRIKRQDFESNAPVATIGSDQIDLSGTVNTESLLNTMPQAVPGLDRTSNNPGNGTATVDLRGLGSNRTLVLMDGTRVVPTTSGGSVDINNIPTALIDRIEVMTGGASAIYGSDAVAGVVNFILKDDFEGVQFNLGTEQTGDGDANLHSADLTIGVNSGDGRGNVVMNISWTDRAELFQGDRDFSFFAKRDNRFDDNGNPILYNGGSSGIPSTRVWDLSPSLTFDNGAAGAEARPYVSAEDQYNYQPVNYIQLPQERYQATVLARYEVAESVEAYGRVLYTSSRVPQQLAPTPIFQTSTFTLDGNPFLSPASQVALSGNNTDTVAVGDRVAAVNDADGNCTNCVFDADGDGTMDTTALIDTDGDGIADTGTSFLSRRLVEVGPRISRDAFSSWQIQGGIRGDIGETSWSYDAYVQVGSVQNTTVQLGNVNRDRYDQALLLDLTDPTGGTCSVTSSNGAGSACAPINIWGEGNISQAGADFIATNVAATATYDQEIYSVTFAGDLFELPGGVIGAAIGYENMDQSFVFDPSQDLAAGTIAGFNGQPATEGGYRTDSYYAEAYLPLLSDLPAIHELDMELAYRSSDYSTIGTVDTYKVAGSWAPIEQVRLRAGFNTAIRAPNVGELFSPISEGFPSGIDPCSAEGSNATDPAISAICQSTGVAANLVGTTQINSAAGQVRQLSGGNPALQEEEAETLTVGVVVTPNFVEGLTFSIDYFNVEIEEYVAAFGGGAANILGTCYSTDPTGGIGSPFCNAIQRRPNSTIEFVSAQLQNVALQTLEGYDLLASYNTELLGGDLQVNYVGTITTENDFTPFAGANVIECAGKFGATCGEPIPEYKHRMTFNWARDQITAQLLWRLVGESDDDDDSRIYFAESLDAESYFDAVVSYDFTENYKLTFGIDNIADTKPPIIADNGEQANTYPATYDVFGRTFYVKASARF